MFTKVLFVCSLVAAAQAGLIAAGHGAVSSQSIVLGHPAPVVRAVAPAWGGAGWGAPAWGGAAWGGVGVGLGHGALIPQAPIAPIAPIVHAAPVAHAVAAPVEVYAHPRYQFNYGVTDGHTGDQKNQWEARDGDVVKGSYSVAEPDGTIRTVNYSADDHNGFNAVVSRHGHAAHPGVVAHAPVVAAHGALLHG